MNFWILLTDEAKAILTALAEDSGFVVAIKAHDEKMIVGPRGRMIPDDADDITVDRYFANVEMLHRLGYITNRGLPEDVYKITEEGLKASKDPAKQSPTASYPRAVSERA